LPEVELDGRPASVEELNARAVVWLTERVHGIASRTTGELPAVRLEVERPFLSALPRTRFDTDYVETRRVHTTFPFIVIDSVRYSVPSKLLGQAVEIRRPVDGDRFEIRWAGQTIATHRVVAGRNTVVWDPAHRVEAEDQALSRAPQRHLRVIEDDKPQQQRLELVGDVDVDAPDLVERYGFGTVDGEETSA
jgi:hypothetical protein